MTQSFFLFPFKPGQEVVLRKKHPCGGQTWTLIRVSSDVTMKCQTCGRKMVLKRSVLEKACKAVKSSQDT